MVRGEKNKMSQLEKYLAEVEKSLREVDHVSWNLAAEILYVAHQNNNNVWVAGNGGNFANSLHFSTDWGKGLFLSTGKTLKVRTIGDNPSLASAFSNDLGFENSVVNHLKMLAVPNDVVVLMTAGGSSENIIRSAVASREMGIRTIGLTGGVGMKFTELFDAHIHVPEVSIQAVEDMHGFFGHAMFKILEHRILLQTEV